MCRHSPYNSFDGFCFNFQNHKKKNYSVNYFTVASLTEVADSKLPKQKWLKLKFLLGFIMILKIHMYLKRGKAHNIMTAYDTNCDVFGKMGTLLNVKVAVMTHDRIHGIYVTDGVILNGTLRI